MGNKLRFVRARLVALGAATMLVLPAGIGGSSASAAEDVWYSIPAFNGVRASAIVSNWNSAGSAAGQIWIRNNTGSGRYYVMFKPDPRGPGGWNRGTPNIVSGAHYYPWEDNFFLYTTGYKFKICKHRRALPDPCGNSLLINLPH